MRVFYKILLLLLLPASTIAQLGQPDSLRNSLAHAANDSVRYVINRRIYDYYEEANRDSAFFYADQCLVLAKGSNKKLAEIHSLNNKAYQLIGLGRYAEALQYLLESFRLVEDPATEKEKTWQLFSSGFNSTFSGSNRLLMLAYTHHMFGILMWQTDNNEQAMVHFREARRISSDIGHNTRQMMADMNLGRSYLMANRLDSALLLEKEAEELSLKTNFKKYLGQVYSVIAGVYERKNDKIQAKLFYYRAVEMAREQNNLNNLSANYFLLTKYYLKEDQKDSALDYAMKNLEIIRQLGPVSGLTVNLGTVYENIYLCYKLGNQQDSLFKYQGLTLAVKDSLYKTRITNLTAFQNLSFREQVRLQDLEKEKTAYQNRIRSWAMLAGLAVVLLIALILYVNNRQKRRSNKVLEKTLSELKSTQSQLVQSEKMASLGELTAGIAHEIQNPLNFVNNFSEVNEELLTEMKEEMSKGKIDYAMTLANDVIENQKKINHHGKRADAIVKGMLQHSRSSNNVKEPTDINALADEYLRLAYHGLRAKDKSFNAKFETDFDNSIGKINIVPQDIGRVILNLITNAFYATNEKKKSGIPGYEPTVVISTRRTPDQVEISVRDNGSGIPPKVLEKIFQPFFTTKPTGEGTGLGLSMSYEIITKAHGGQLKAETREGEYAEFLIILPNKT